MTSRLRYKVLLAAIVGIFVAWGVLSVLQGYRREREALARLAFLGIFEDEPGRISFEPAVPESVMINVSLFEIERPARTESMPITAAEELAGDWKTLESGLLDRDFATYLWDHAERVWSVRWYSTDGCPEPYRIRINPEKLYLIVGYAQNREGFYMGPDFLACGIGQDGRVAIQPSELGLRIPTEYGYANLKDFYKDAPFDGCLQVQSGAPFYKYNHLDTSPHAAYLEWWGKDWPAPPERIR